MLAAHNAPWEGRAGPEGSLGYGREKMLDICYERRKCSVLGCEICMHCAVYGTPLGGMSRFNRGDNLVSGYWAKVTHDFDANYLIVS